MILRRNNLRNKSPKSKVSLKKIYASTKKHCSEIKLSNQRKKSINNAHIFDNTKKTDKINQDLQASKTKIGKILVSNKIKSASVHSSSYFNDHSLLLTTVSQPTVSLRKLSSSLALRKDTLELEKIGSRRKKQSVSLKNLCPAQSDDAIKVSIIANKKSGFSPVNNSDSKIPASKSVKKNEDLHQKSRTKVSPQVLLTKKKKTNLSAKDNLRQKANNESQDSEQKQSCSSKRKTASKKAVSSTSSLDNLTTTGLRAKLRSSTSSLGQQSASTKVSKLKLTNKSSGQPTKIKFSQKTGSNKIQNFKGKKKQMLKKNIRSDNLSTDSEKNLPEIDDLLLNTSTISNDLEDSSKELFRMQRRNKKYLPAEEVRRSKRCTRNSTKSDIETKKGDLARDGKKKKVSTKLCPEERVNNKFNKRNSRCKDSESNKIENRTESRVANKKNEEQKSKSLSHLQNTLERYSRHSKPIPVDDLNRSMSTPHSVERLFTSRRTSLSSTPLLVKKSSKLQSFKGSKRDSRKSAQSDIETNKDDLARNGKKKKESTKHCSNKTENIKLNKKNSGCRDSESNKILNILNSRVTSKRNEEQKRQTVPKVKKTISKGVTTDKKSLPRKGSLKRKRLAMSSLKKRNEGYEDDLFENCEFKEPFLLDESDMSDVSIATPKCGYVLSPKIPSKTPRFQDCYSPFELLKARKVAEEYMHIRKKMRRNCSSMEDASFAGKETNSKKSNVADVCPEVKKLEFLELVDTLNKRQNSMELNDDSEEEADDYFNDVSF